jgi:hypothetical protein
LVLFAHEVTEISYILYGKFIRYSAKKAHQAAKLAKLMHHHAKEGLNAGLSIMNLTRHGSKAAPDSSNPPALASNPAVAGGAGQSSPRRAFDGHSASSPPRASAHVRVDHDTEAMPGSVGGAHEAPRSPSTMEMQERR